MKTVSFFGRGLAFPFKTNGVGSIDYIEGEQHIEQSLKLLLLTALGERVMRPKLGCKAPKLVFSPGSIQYLRLLENTVADAIKKWEPRVELQSVLAETEASKQNHVLLNISYKVRSSNARNNLVFPFYLGVDFSAGKSL